MSEYSFFARFYDELTQNVDYERRAEHFSALLLSYGIKSGTVLDLACGTGTLTSLISARGYDMIGVDSSPDMLSQAQNRAFEEGQNILFLCQQMQALDLFGKIDAALCTLDSINHLTEPDDVRETFRRLGTFIRPGGMFIFDVNTIYKHREILADNSFVYEYPDVFCVWQNSLDEETDTVDIMLDFSRKTRTGHTSARAKISASAHIVSTNFQNGSATRALTLKTYMTALQMNPSEKIPSAR